MNKEQRKLADEAGLYAMAFVIDHRGDGEAVEARLMALLNQALLGIFVPIPIDGNTNRLQDAVEHIQQIVAERALDVIAAASIEVEK